jgi:hypothetical protein
MLSFVVLIWDEHTIGERFHGVGLMFSYPADLNGIGEV